MGEGGAVIGGGVSRAAFGQDMHLAWGNTPLAAMLVDTKDSIEGGGKATLATPTRDPQGSIREDIPSKGDRQAPATGILGGTTNTTQKIKNMMQPYLDHMGGRVRLAEILDAVGKHQTDLPMLQKYIHATGRPFLCWSSVLGRCTFRDCRFKKEGGHHRPTDITDEFSDQIIDVINKGIVTLCSLGGGSPPKKQKTNGGNQA